MNCQSGPRRLMNQSPAGEGDGQHIKSAHCIGCSRHSRHAGLIIFLHLDQLKPYTPHLSRLDLQLCMLGPVLGRSCNLALPDVVPGSSCPCPNFPRDVKYHLSNNLYMLHKLIRTPNAQLAATTIIVSMNSVSVMWCRASFIE